jgi:hypothetical protein
MIQLREKKSRKLWQIDRLISIFEVTLKMKDGVSQTMDGFIEGQAFP